MMSLQGASRPVFKLIRPQELLIHGLYLIFAPSTLTNMTKKALSLSEFINLPQDLQFEILHKHGVYVGKRKMNGQTVVLFQLHGFYVEVYYKQYRKTIDHLITSSETDILQPYLDQIHIKDLSDRKNKN